MKYMNYSLLLKIITGTLLCLSMLIISTAGIPKTLILGIFLVVFSFTILAAMTLRNIKKRPTVDRNEKVLDIIFSTFELHAHRLPDGEEFDLADLKIERKMATRKKGKVDSFEIHL